MKTEDFVALKIVRFLKENLGEEYDIFKGKPYGLSCAGKNPVCVNLGDVVFAIYGESGFGIPPSSVYYITCNVEIERRVSSLISGLLDFINGDDDPNVYSKFGIPFLRNGNIVLFLIEGKMDRK